jgi:hypothetical protein
MDIERRIGSMSGFYERDLEGAAEVLNASKSLKFWSRPVHWRRP